MLICVLGGFLGRQAICVMQSTFVMLRQPCMDGRLRGGVDDLDVALLPASVATATQYGNDLEGRPGTLRREYGTKYLASHPIQQHRGLVPPVLPGSTAGVAEML